MGQTQNSGEAKMHSFMDNGEQPAAVEGTHEEGHEGYEGFDEDGFDDGNLNEYDGTLPESGAAHKPPIQQDSAKMPRLPLVIGVSMLLMGLAHAFLSLGLFSSPESNALLLLTKLGLSPALLFISGTLAITLALSHRGSSRVSSTRVLTALECELEAIQQNMAAVLSDGFAGLDNKDGGGEHLGQFTIMFQKLENMIKNLTKATRMHSKPLMDLVGQVTDLGRELHDLKTAQDLIATTNKDERTQLEKIHEKVAKLAKSNNDGGSSGIDPLSIASIQQNVQKILDGMGSDFHTAAPRHAPAPASANATTPLAKSGGSGASENTEEGKPSGGVLSAIERLRQLRGG